MGHFSTMAGSNPTQGGIYFNAGFNYDIEIVAVKMVLSRKNQDLYCVECKVLSSDDPERGPGSTPAWMPNMTNESSMGNIKGFLAACNGVDPNDQAAVKAAFTDANGQDLSEAVAELSVSEDNPLAGTILKLRTENKLTKAGNPFTLHFWHPVETVE